MSVCANCFVWYRVGDLYGPRKPCRNGTGTVCASAALADFEPKRPPPPAPAPLLVSWQDAAEKARARRLQLERVGLVKPPREPLFAWAWVALLALVTFVVFIVAGS